MDWVCKKSRLFFPFAGARGTYTFITYLCTLRRMSSPRKRQHRRRGEKHIVERTAFRAEKMSVHARIPVETRAPRVDRDMRRRPLRYEQIQCIVHSGLRQRRNVRHQSLENLLRRRMRPVRKQVVHYSDPLHRRPNAVAVK